MSKPLKVALLGAGVVGSQVARIILKEGGTLESRIGRRLELVGIGVRNAATQRPGIDPALITTDLEGLVSRGDLDIVIELIGGIEPALGLLRTAIANGASVVSANKALLADYLGELSRDADARGVDLYYEAAVAGAIPIIRPLRESLVGDDITAVMGIVNGTTNYILDKMVTEQVSYDSALAEAQQLGYAEADPTADVEGHDAAAKAAILAGLAFHTEVKREEVFCEGITSVTPDDIAAAELMGCTVKLLAIAKLTDDDRVIVKVHPAMVANKHPLASVSGAYNAIFVNSREAGELMFLGQGAGGAPTASAVMGDVVTVARNRHRGTAGHLGSAYTARQVAPIGESQAQFYVSFEVVDRPGVLARCAAVFGDHGVSLRVVQQSYIEGGERREGFAARLGVMTHVTQETNLSAVVEELGRADFVGSEIRVMRVEGF
ncbi:homoserine dehydrogenase [Tessaracoccus flavus]|uniref:Homoserine dehydrogenase n=1 Tax=Tessaracoccus flavus TaxID=1610493 RepID=A0A1Q2CEQ1_9ACTN|nr:homoserine dehydrogenase [Tessaracoccus flavus]AQP44550.1 homoserine dehydrogenase [Tessaracoccus flavus]SDZ09985.1 homoserine dehydrogenase [Tessaracoccus flavus]